MADPRVLIVGTTVAVLVGASAYAIGHDHEPPPFEPSFDQQETTVRLDDELLRCTVQGVVEHDKVVNITFIDCWTEEP